MDGQITDGRTGRLWMCKKHEGHPLGIILNENGRERLLLFRMAINVERDNVKIIVLPPMVVMGLVEGTMYDIECNLCGAKRTWWIDKKITISLLAPMYDKSLTK
ncbi:MAG: hypothetical protein HY863_15650 [Chloroflexi bacterium]|nr:hypothetical protein [Chloroflexota bacterium]